MKVRPISTKTRPTRGLQRRVRVRVRGRGRGRGRGRVRVRVSRPTRGLVARGGGGDGRWWGAAAVATRSPGCAWH